MNEVRIAILQILFFLALFLKIYQQFIYTNSQGPSSQYPPLFQFSPRVGFSVPPVGFFVAWSGGTNIQISETSSCLSGPLQHLGSFQGTYRGVGQKNL